MTREEAIQLIDEIASSYYPCDKKDALEMAIKALEPKPYEKFESAKDHIYKLAGDYKCWDNRLTEDEAVELCHILEQEPCYNPDEWCKTCKEYDHDKHCCPRYNKVIRNTVEEMKQTNIRTAEWVLLDECSNSGYYCSECHKKLVKEGWSDTIKKIKYCPNCGCRMVKPQESE